MNFYRLLLYIILAACCIANMARAAAPSTHVFTAEMWMDLHGPRDQEAREAFIAGTLFPDIRYLGVISREETHEKRLTAKKIRNTPNPFIAGKRLHAFVDEKREKFVRDSHMYSNLKKIPKKTRVLFLKLLEDEILWERIDFSLFPPSLQKIHQEEIDAGIEEDMILLWHQKMLYSLNQKPSVFLSQLAAENKPFLGADAKMVKQWSHLIPAYAENPRFVSYVESMLLHLAQEFKK